ncbi:hypothetical protein [Paracoccus nototheniae]|uniref:Uncharacterized protein n=1 Tax=Paracoccus nototheniae TaxID=2489002 RepID=A0ABW4DUG4_9RHOB|nr:hypothetical protein [Paracoccus nototheniae]
MLFDVQAALAEILSEAPACCDFRDSRDLRNPVSRKSQESQSQPDEIPALSDRPVLVSEAFGAGMGHLPNRGNSGNRSRYPDEITQPPAPASPLRQDEPRPDEYGRCHTWTGRVVHLDEWRALTAWDRHGPAGRLFCGICQGWVNREAGCAQRGCWKAEGGAA